MTKKHLYPLFLGPYGENNDLLEKVLTEFLRDHVYWRRNFHPEDPPAIPTMASSDPEYQQFVGRMTHELHKLSAALKHSVPFSSPRYIGHMASDTLLPALIAQLMTVPYNPNNVVDEAAPVTLDMEISAGLQLARMVGYEDDETRPDCAFGHLTGGGTVANYESLHVMRAIRHYPLALAAALRDAGDAPDVRLEDGSALRDADTWRLANLPYRQVIALYEQLLEKLESMPNTAAEQWLERVESERVESLGWAEFQRRHPDWNPPVILVPVTAHYSWSKGAKLIGLGSANVRVIPERGMRMDVAALRKTLDELAEKRVAVLECVGVLGTTEFGTIDPIHELVAERDSRLRHDQYLPIHIDAAWGGYLASLFRKPDGSLASQREVRRGFKYFPSESVHAAFRALAETESITIDPHKLGFVPFGAGAVVFRDQRMMDFVAQSADYVFDPARAQPGYRDKFRALGRYILEGSKPGAAAAGVFVSHTVMPPDRAHLGRIIEETVHATEYFYDRVPGLAEQVGDVAQLAIPFEPDSNLICIALNPRGNASLKVLNQFARQVFSQMKVDASRPVQSREFFGSYTTLTRRGLGEKEFQRCLDLLGISDTDGEDRIFILRHTLMNPWLIDNENGINYIDRYCDFLSDVIHQTARSFDNG
ncbi:MAG: pyridoxal-dependent decarboxylase [Gammaproteobacteria bacterium]|nr:pyridoxal-dependent decarboxylase [Gammaproteobacteria bacterium]